jgi:glucose dehydrogenase
VGRILEPWKLVLIMNAAAPRIAATINESMKATINASRYSRAESRTLPRVLPILIALASTALPAASAAADGPAPNGYQLFARTNLVAWCIVPFDAKKRGPEARAAMLERIGIRRFAYDYRAEHIPTFDAEMDALERHHIELTAWWFPTVLNDEARLILDVLKRHKLHIQLWVTGGGAPTGSPEEQRARVEAEANRLRPIADAARAIGCTVALYNHEAWFGEPENQLAILAVLRSQGVTNVGLVYNLHHGHSHLDRFAVLLSKMKPYLMALNLNGMTPHGNERGEMILPLAQGDLDLTLLRLIRESGWHGPIGILNHTDEDAEARLLDNLDGLEWLTKKLDGKDPGPKPKPRSWSPPPKKAALPPAGSTGPGLSAAFGKALRGGLVVEGRPEYRQPPLTIECRALLNGSGGFNILVASDPKASAKHWELYSYAGSGAFSVYLPGRGGEFKSEVNICDRHWHYLAAILESNRVRLYVDGKLAKDAPAPPLHGQPVPGGLAFGRLVEGGIGCDGLVDDVRLTRGARAIRDAPKKPLERDGPTIGHWNFDDLRAGQSVPVSRDPWAVEDARARSALPEYQEIPGAPVAELTPARGFPNPHSMTNWNRSHGDATSSRFSALTQINRKNVERLEVAWTYHSQDGNGNIQCNPIIVSGLIYAPTVGHHIVALDAETGSERWRFKPELPGGALRLEDMPARRGLVYWPGAEGVSSRLFFTCGNWVYALNPRTGRPLPDFGQSGRAYLPAGGTVAGAVFQRILIVPGFARDVYGFDAANGKLLWTFHTIPHPGEFGYDTWDRPAEGANCWGGMALDEARGIAFVATGSPKPNFDGSRHHGNNLFGNCVIALDALTGRRLWHFQEIRHDIWDLDIPAPPNLVSVTKEGRRVDAVAQVTKLGNTLLLDRLSGRPLFPFRLRRAPSSPLPGEWTAPYQPDPELPEPFARQDFGRDDVTTRDDEAHDYVLQRLAGVNCGWFQPFQEAKPTVLYGIHGGAEWTGAAFDPTTGWLYVSANEIPWIITVFQNDPEPPRDPRHPTLGEQLYLQSCAACHGPDRMGVGTAPPLRGLRHRLTDADVLALWKTGRNLMPIPPPMTKEEQQALLDFLFLRDRPQVAVSRTRPDRPDYTNNGYPKLLDPEGYPGCKPPWGTLNCLDLNTGKLRWKVPLGEYPELSAAGLPKTGTENFGGAIVTAGGLVFCAGTRDEKIRAFDSATGVELWSHQLPWGGNAPPATYEVHGRQYVVIAASGGGKLGGPTGDAYVAFTLPRADSVLATRASGVER